MGNILVKTAASRLCTSGMSIVVRVQCIDGQQCRSVRSLKAQPYIGDRLLQYLNTWHVPACSRRLSAEAVCSLQQDGRDIPISN